MALDRVPFRALFHADWSIAAKKRWLVEASPEGDRWRVSVPRLVGGTAAFVDAVFRAEQPVLAGFDFPIGLPAVYGQATGLANFMAALDAFGHDEWSDFYTVATIPEQISRTRPFYPQASTAASKQVHLLRGLGVENIGMLRRQCERATHIRSAACPLFWTLGGNQVGKAAISGWQEVVAPARQRGARLWPFDGSLSALVKGNVPVIAETYPAEAYSHVGVSFRRSMSKRRPDDRHAATRSLPAWAHEHRVLFSEPLIKQIENGFGHQSSGEDQFDALIGLLGMIEVVDGRRPEQPEGLRPGACWEGWILGQGV